MTANGGSPLTVVLGRSGQLWEQRLLGADRGAVSVVQSRTLVDLLVAVETAAADVVVVGEAFPRLVEGLSRLRSLARVVVVGDSALADVSADQVSIEAVLNPQAAGSGSGRVVTVWGPPGSWGTTTVAVGVARGLAAQGPTVLIDANVHAACVGDALDLPLGGLLQACLSADRGDLRLTTHSVAGLDVITGVEPALYPAVHAGALQEVVRAARRQYAYIVMDVDSALDPAADIGIAPDWTTASAVGLREADEVVVVVGESPLARRRLWRGLPALVQSTSAAATVVVNRCSDPRATTAELAAHLGDHLPEAALGWISGPVTSRSLAPIIKELCG